MLGVFVRLLLLIVRALWAKLRDAMFPVSPSALHANQAFLKGGYAPVVDELAQVPLENGEGIPEDFPAGLFVRNGSNPRWTPRRPYHWFDGDGHLHAVHFLPENPADEPSHGNQKRALYSNAFVRTTRFLDEEAAAGPLYFGLADVLSPERLLGVLADRALQAVGLRRRLLGRSVANTNVVFHHRRLLALVEADVPYVVLAPSLETVGTEDWEGRVEIYTAHPKIDARTGEMMGVMYRFDRAPHCQYYVVGPNGHLQIVHDIDLQTPVMMHDMAVSESHSLILDLPLNFRVERILYGRSPLAYQPASPSRVGLLPRRP
ncbi:MAG: carotenoid oxygenase family protein, partial [archaeon]|nr:carotenoid oxygenase family protein [archaeon]